MPTTGAVSSVFVVSWSLRGLRALCSCHLPVGPSLAPRRAEHPTGAALLAGL
ncbi:hypothetical protein [Embleya sp. NPDC020886]|uniref:hypothetical protein n=1 Tax=Embleya sp. NPDC020886 TaxID=3363980 RepID=UPI003791BF62